MSVTQGAVERARGRVGTLVKEKWKLEALLGVGGTACVYSAVHRNGRRVAIKVLHPELCTIPSVVTRFLREGYLANRVGHPNAVAVLDDDRMDDGPVFLVMELLEGCSLERYAKPGHEKLPRSTVVRIMDQTLEVLASAHAKGIVHRDIKPANLFLTTDGQLKVLDFGIARLTEPLTDSQLTQTGASIGTPSFMPPEQARGRWEQVDQRTDVWAVGATMYALLKGDRPRHAETLQEEMLLAMTQQLAPLATVVPDIAPEIAAIVDRAVAHERDARWPDATAMRQAVAGLRAAAPAIESGARWPAAPDAGLGTYVPTIAIPDVALTTGRPFSSQAITSVRPRSRGTELTIFVAAAVVTLALVATGGVMVAKRSHPATPPPPVVASSLPTGTPSPTTETEPAPTPAPTVAVTTTPAPIPSQAPPSPSSSSPRSRASGPAPSRPAPRPSPAQPPRGTPANPFDQRF